MAEHKTQPTDASVDEFLDAVESDRRRADARTVLELRREAGGGRALQGGVRPVASIPPRAAPTC